MIVGIREDGCGDMKRKGSVTGQKNSGYIMDVFTNQETGQTKIPDTRGYLHSL